MPSRIVTWETMAPVELITIIWPSVVPNNTCNKRWQLHKPLKPHNICTFTIAGWHTDPYRLSDFLLNSILYNTQGLFSPHIFVRENVPFGQIKWEIFKFNEIFSLPWAKLVRFFAVRQDFCILFGYIFSLLILYFNWGYQVNKKKLNKDLLFSLFPTRKINRKVPLKVNKENELWKKKTTLTEKKNSSEYSQSCTLSEQEEGWGSRRYNVLQHVTIPTGRPFDRQFSFVMSEAIFTCFFTLIQWSDGETLTKKNKWSTYNFYDKSFQWYRSQRLASSNCIRNE